MRIKNWLFLISGILIYIGYFFPFIDGCPITITGCEIITRGFFNSNGHLRHLNNIPIKSTTVLLLFFISGVTAIIAGFINTPLTLVSYCLACSAIAAGFIMKGIRFLNYLNYNTGVGLDFLLLSFFLMTIGLFVVLPKPSKVEPFSPINPPAGETPNN